MYMKIFELGTGEIAILAGMRRLRFYHQDIRKCDVPSFDKLTTVSLLTKLRMKDSDDKDKTTRIGCFTVWFGDGQKTSVAFNGVAYLYSEDGKKLDRYEECADF